MTPLKRDALLLYLASTFSSLASADEIMPTIPRHIGRTQPDDTALQITSERQRELDAVERELKERRRAFEAGQPPAIMATPAPQSSLGASDAMQGSNLTGPQADNSHQRLQDAGVSH